jgi:hydroxymethylglutaryl-CoA lyase
MISYLFSNLIPQYPEIEFGAHLHTTPDKWFEKIDAAYHAGCRRYDGAIQGFGGCPMAKDDLTGNMPTEKLLSYLLLIKKNKPKPLVLKVPIMGLLNCLRIPIK